MDHQDKEGVVGYEIAARISIGLGAVCLLVAVALFLLKIPGISASLPIDPNIFAAFGNLASGSVGLFWSLAGIFLFYGALRLQRADLRRQREEFKRSMTVAEQAMKTAEKQSEVSQIQKFDSTFFSLLNQHNEIVKAVSITMAVIPSQKITGRDSFGTLYTYLWDFVTKIGATRGGVPNRDLDLKRTLDAYEGWWEKEEPRAGHYFRHLYNLIKFVDRSSTLTYEEKRVYTNIVRAQLSSYELLLLFYNCLSICGRDKFKGLVEKYHLLKWVPGEKLINEKHKEAYSASAFE